MRILSVHNRYQVRGGEDESYEAELHLLRQHGHLVDAYEEDNRRLAKQGHLRIAMQTVWSSAAFDEVHRRLAQGSHELMHVQNFFPLISPSIYHAARQHGVPVVQTLHNYRLLCPGALLFRKGRVCEQCLTSRTTLPGVWHGCYRNSRLATAVVSAMLTVHRAMRTWTRKVNLYIALTQFARSKFIDGGLPPERIVVKPHFVYPDPGAGDATGGYALFVTRLTPEKGINTTLAAWRRLGMRIPLKIVGDGPLARHLPEMIRDLPQVEWLGRKPLAEVYRLMARASCVLFPSEWYETFGRIIIEAFATGTPVIASHIGGVPELIVEGKTGLLFEPGNADDLAEKVEQILSSPVQLARMRDNARREFEAHYTAERNYQRLLSIYRNATRRCSDALR